MSETKTRAPKKLNPFTQYAKAHEKAEKVRRAAARADELTAKARAAEAKAAELVAQKEEAEAAEAAAYEALQNALAELQGGDLTEVTDEAA